MALQVKTDVAVAAHMFRGFGDPIRLAIVTELLAGERRVVDLVGVLGCSQSNVSGHLTCLKDCGLIVDRPEGRSVYYRLATPAVVDLLRQAEALLGEIGERVELCENYRDPR